MVCACVRVNLIKHWTLQGRMERFKVMIQANPCAFNIYDANGDGAITWEEFEAIFGEGETTHKLAEALDESGELIWYIFQPHKSCSMKRGFNAFA